ncbi:MULTISPECIES: peroxiredoxin family protein [Bacillaceae]|jgi:peroxiredoxin|uniref:Alkyl hydroperoxide reductase n=1 Tax=Oceanobacillus caeni TaxID=405946 RepID=A0ABR5MG53_9BACI|nr:MULTISPECIES: redoxin domain-containing protein [Bacillaceae]NMB18427.1 redoxin domain-containing protein [Erysipelothrix sp.]KPH71460.1 alkyl hydroperoxide reductase [Oceanobacillus caeni]MBU8791380.1 redoxin domain-containing protein [Oceanobacillus caeni]MDF1510994.1 redoxin domain-containing protein [Robertmurraya sp. DFI.2.37]MED4475466.1 redoxin domain-containing protein [Oceanobacillus caeni]
MKKWILLVVVIGMVGWAVYDFLDSNKKSAVHFENVEELQEVEAEATDEGVEENQKPVIGLEVGNKAPDFQLDTLSGDSVKLSDFRGHRVMINFWATWCPPCRAEMPDMEKFHQDKDIVILAVNLTNSESSVEDIENFADEYKLTFPVLMDSNLDVANLYAIQPIPTTYMVDSNGLISYKAYGAMNYDLMVQEFEKME